MSKIHHPNGDPRVVYARLAHLIPEERFVAWEERAECLCGCGTQTKEIALGRGKYKDAHSYWSGTHYHSFRREQGLPGHHGAANRKPSWYANTQKARMKSMQENYVNPAAISEMVKQYLDDNNLDFTNWAKANNFSAVEHVRRIVNGNGPKRIHPKTAIKLLEAIGERPHPALVEKVAA